MLDISPSSTAGELLTQEEAARILKTAPKTLRGWRVEGKGPRYVKVGDLVRYRPADIDAYIEERTIVPSGSRPRLARG